MKVLVSLVLCAASLSGCSAEKLPLATKVVESSPGQLWAEQKCGKHGVRIYIGEETAGGWTYAVQCRNGDTYKEFISNKRVWI
jgi:hypothetical protein